MIKKFRLLFIFTLALAFATTAFAQDSIEIGDSIEDEADGDVVEYEIELAEGDSIGITLESGDFDPLVRILDEDEDELDYNDDTDGRNSYLEFTAEGDGVYIIVVDAFGSPDNADGGFELTIEALDAAAAEEDAAAEDSASSGDADFEYGDEIDFDVDGEEELEVTFEGQEGDAVTILTRSDAEQNIRIFLEDPEGDEIASNSEYNYGNAFLVRVLLEADGLYTIRLEEVDGEDLEDDIEIELIETELLDLGDGEQTTEIDSNVGEDYMFFEAEEDVEYIIFVTLDGEISSALDIEIYQEADTYSPSARASFRDIEQAIFGFKADDDGIVILSLDYWGYNGEIEVTIEVEADE